MIARLVGFALHQRFVTLAAAVLLVGVGIVAFKRLPIEAYPDVADAQVDVITLWPGHAAEEIEAEVRTPPSLPFSASFPRRSLTASAPRSNVRSPAW